MNVNIKKQPKVDAAIKKATTKVEIDLKTITTNIDDVRKVDRWKDLLN
jgi:rRNA processing protein Krr1/Pno1